MYSSWISWLWGRKTIRFYHSPDTIQINSKNGTVKRLAAIVKSITPPCYLNPFLFNGHLQTIWTALVSLDNPPTVYKRRIFQQEDPVYKGEFSVDFVVPASSIGKQEPPSPEEHADPWKLPPRTYYFTDEEWDHIASDDSKPMLITLHGLSGGSHELYLRKVIAELAPDGWECIVINARGCARTKISSPVLYNARSTWDVRHVVRWARRTYPNRPLFAIGYSLGANILTNYIGEEADKCLLKAAAVVSNPWSLEICNAHMKYSFSGWYLYSRVLGAAMRKLAQRHSKILSENHSIDMEEVVHSKHLFLFDRHLQGPTWGYPSEGAYYRDAGSCDAVENIAIPFLALHAEDDPVTHKSAIAYQELAVNPFCVLVTTSCGGHLGWFEWGGGRWYVKPVVNFLNEMWRNVDHVETQKGVAVLKEQMHGRTGVADGHFHAMRRRLIYAHRDNEDGSLRDLPDA